MIRVCLTAAAVCIFVLAVTAVIGRAIDYETAEHVIFTRDGVTLDCVRVVGAHGNVFYNDCSQVP